MTGAIVSWHFEDAAVQRAFQRLEFAVKDPTPVLRAIGTGLIAGTHKRFENEVSPDGTSWEALSAGYAEIKKGPGILRGSGMRGGLMGSITMQAGSDYVEVGTNKVHAAIHQFGGTIKAKTPKGLFFFTGDGAARPQSVTIPARQYLGPSHEDGEMTLDVIEGAIRRA